MAAGGSFVKDSAFYKKVINKCRRQIIADLDPVALLDVFLEEDYVTDIQERDIRELASTSDKNRDILSKVSSKGVKGFLDFKMCLVKASQKHLAEHLEDTEAKLEEEALAFQEVSAFNNRTAFKCSVCDLSYGTVKLLEQHSQTLEHMDMVRELEEFAKENQGENEEEEEEEESGEFTSISDSLNSVDGRERVSHCYLCNINFTSSSHANSHFTGRPHKKRKALFDLKHQQPTHEAIGEGSVEQSLENVDQPDVCTILQQDTLELSYNTVSVQPIKKGLTCGICQVSFSGENNAKDHYASERHKKKELLLKRQTLGEALPLSCDICNCSFTGPENAEAHFKSEKHKKKSNKVKAEGTELEKQKFGGSLPLSCEICMCNFTGPESAKAHFDSEKHKKKANKVKVEGIEALTLYCDICSCSFTSEENAKQHYEGRKHRKNAGDASTQNRSLRLHSDDLDTSSNENNANCPGQNNDAVQDIDDEVSANLENLSLSDN